MTSPEVRPRVLVVDDNDANLTLVKAALRKTFDVQGVSTGEEVRLAVDSGFPELILMDIGLPDTDGIQLTKELRARPGFDVPIVALTAHALPSDEAAARAAGCVEFITKPINTRTIAADLLRVLESSRSTS